MSRYSIAFPVIMAIAALLPRSACAQSADAGQPVFKQACAVCHDTVAGKNRIGPSLFGIVGREAGSVPNFHYSDGNRKSGLMWSVATLDKYLINPHAMIPATTMSYAGVKDDQKRHDLIAYLATLH